MKLILASQSPRRKQLLEQLGLSFIISTSGVEEMMAAGRDPEQLVKELALAKAKDVAAKFSSGVVIGADTLVVLGDEPLGKPSTQYEAREMLQRLSGRMHRVVTGVAVVAVPAQRMMTECVTTKVKFRELSSRNIEAYLATGEYIDKAGSYAIQGIGALLVEGIDGCYFNVVGLPLVKLAEMLQKVGIQVLGEKKSDQRGVTGLSPNH
ncbi:Maf family protein [Metallumcola ferriviriculae]|uniref:dTTP/UTP pyrophosphatase n=1 Tax=Metallumcola ferriviriculae TaxID=3039180 RepID=A0AAU0UMZ0_9FIRM|nr:Maf family protein [Desulfitibacteraceae bacterium MK1]